MESTLQIDSLDFRNRVEKLIGVLNVHVDTHRQLAKLLEEKKLALVQMDYENLEGLLEYERTVIERIGDIERERMDVTEDLSVFLGRPAGSSIRLVELIMLAGDDYREDLLDLRDEIRDVADRIDRVNKLNGSMVIQSLEDIHLYIAMLTGVDPDAKTYDQSGKSGEGPSSLLFDRTV
jgi:flagellar biosynthesis/type III secretory pathway chaperone